MKYQFPNKAIESLCWLITRKIEEPNSNETFSENSTFGKLSENGLFRTGIKRAYKLSDQEKLDVFQQTQAIIIRWANDRNLDCAAIFSPTREGKLIFATLNKSGNVKDAGETPPLNRLIAASRKMLRANGGSHDREKFDSLEYLSENGQEFFTPTREDLADTFLARIDLLKMQVKAAAEKDKSRQKAANIRNANKFVEQLETGDWQAMSYHARKMQIKRFRKWLGMPQDRKTRKLKSDAESIAQSIASNFNK